MKIEDILLFFIERRGACGGIQCIDMVFVIFLGVKLLSGIGQFYLSKGYVQIVIDRHSYMERKEVFRRLKVCRRYFTKL